MTSRDDFIGQLEGYLDDFEGMTPLPDAVRDAVRAQLPTNKQIGPISGLMRDITMNTRIPAPARYGLVAAVAVAAVVLAATLLGRGPNVGGEPTPSPSPLLLSVLGAGPLEAGRYVTDQADPVFPIAVSLTLPDGWSQTWALEKAGVNISFWSVANISSDPCRWETTLLDPVLGPGVQDLVSALEAQVGRTGTTTTPVAVDGHSGQLMDLDWPASLDLLTCDRSEYHLFEGPGGDAPRANAIGRHSMLWILDVDGARIVIEGTYPQGGGAAERAEIQAIVDTMQIGPAS